MAKMRVYELSRELNVSSKDIISVLTENGVDVKSASSNVEDDAIRLVRSRFAKGGALKAEPADNSVQKDDSTAADKASKESSSAEISANGESEDEGDKKLKKRRRPKKKKNITAVFNMQYSKNQKGASSKEASGSRSAQDRRRREDNRRGAFRPAGGASHIIRPRPESERTVRPKATRQRPEEPMLKKDYMPAPKAEEPKAPVKPPVKKEVQKPAEAAPEVKAVQKPKETKAEPKNTAPVRSGDSSDIKSENRNIRSTSDNHGSGRGNQGAKPQSGGQRNTAKSGGRQNGGSSQQQQQGGRGGRNQKFSKPAKQGDQKNRNAKGNAQGRDNRPNSKHKNKDRDALGKKKEHYVNLEKKTAKKRGKNQNKQEQRNPDEILTLTLPEHLTIRELADKMKIQPSTIVKSLFMKGTMATVNQDIDYETAEEIALEFNCVCEPEEKVDVIAELLKEEEEDPKTMTRRPPVVCVMGHVDHGKTSLLDAIRDTRVTAREAGGITQKIGAYVVDIDDRNITFLDTPGHEAFTAMRMRGANSTDIAILVVAADDGVMPQTIEAINHAKAADIEIIVAINKIDKPNANIERVKQELSEYQLIPEDWGGSTIFVPVSAHTHEGIDELLEMILLTADVMELSANPKRNARGLVIEAELDKGRGAVATVLVQKGTLKVGDPVAAGSSFGRVRAMIDDNGKNVKKAGPSMPVEILGLSEVPNAGEIFVAMDSEKEARSFANTFVTESKNRMVEDSRMKMSLDDLFSKIQAGNLKELDIIVKADVQGSVEAVRQSLEKLSNDEVIVKVIHGGVGSITESDVTLASASNAIIIGFNVRPDPISKQTAESEGVDIRLYKVIYNAIEDVEAAMKGMLEPVYEEKVIGHAEVRQIFKSSDVGNIAGSYILDGHFERNCKTRVFRGDEQIFEGSLASLKRFKDDVKEVKSGYECGIVLDGFSDFVEEDRIEAYIMVEVPR